MQFEFKDMNGSKNSIAENGIQKLIGILIAENGIQKN